MSFGRKGARHESRRTGWCTQRKKEFFILGNTIASIMALQSRLKSNQQRRSHSRVGKADWPIFRRTAKDTRRHFAKEIETEKRFTQMCAVGDGVVSVLELTKETGGAGSKMGSALVPSAAGRCATLRRGTASSFAAMPRRGKKNPSNLRRTPASASASWTPQKSTMRPVLWL
jgi:hypothetical protein